MVKVLNLTGLGIAPNVAQGIAGFISINQTATGTSSQANSFAITTDITSFSTAPTNSGCRLPPSSPGDTYTVSNGDANSMLIYPPVGGKLNYGSVNASLTLTTLQSADCTCLDNLNYIVQRGS